MIAVAEIGDSGAFLVTLECGHKRATRERATSYHCNACEGPPPSVEPAATIAEALHVARAEIANLKTPRVFTPWDGLSEAERQDEIDAVKMILRRKVIQPYER